MILLVCGSRGWHDHATIIRELRLIVPRPTCIIHGAATGADSIAGELGRLAGVEVVEFPADWDRDGKAAGPLRNALMLAEGKPDRCLAVGALWKRKRSESPCKTSYGFWAHTGTGDMVSRCLAARLPVRWVEAPGGEARDLREMPWPT